MPVAEPETAAADPESAPTRYDFIAEVLDPAPTSNTARFHDYHADSYHVDKLDVLMGVTELAAERGLRPRALLIIGPTLGDPLWSYFTMVFLQEGDAIRVNWLRFPHARITGKFTGVLSEDRFAEWVAEIIASGVPQSDPPPGRMGKTDSGAPLSDWDYDFLMALWEPDAVGRRTLYGTMIQERDVIDRFLAAYNGLLEQLKQSYPPSEK